MVNIRSSDVLAVCVPIVSFTLSVVAAGLFLRRSQQLRRRHRTLPLGWFAKSTIVSLPSVVLYKTMLTRRSLVHRFGRSCDRCIQSHKGHSSTRTRLENMARREQVCLPPSLAGSLSPALPRVPAAWEIFRSNCSLPPGLGHISGFSPGIHQIRYGRTDQ